LREEGKFSEAEKEARKALDLNPKDPHSRGTLGDILADERWLDWAEDEYRLALENSDEMEDSAKSEIHNNLGWVYAEKNQYENAKDEFFKARTIDPSNVKAIRNLRLITKVKLHPEITINQIAISILLLLQLSLSTYFFWIDKLKETAFSALIMFFTAAILFVLFYKSIGKVSVGPEGFNFEMSDEHRLAPAQAQIAERISTFER
jgi:tetratricopeptide (TPR) repeat protein